MTNEPDRFDGVCIITWPSTQHASGGLLPTWPMTIADARTGTLILSVVRLRVIAGFEPGSGIVAELTMLCDPDGNPYLDNSGEPITRQADGTVREETFRYLVSEMRIAEPGVEGV